MNWSSAIVVYSVCCWDTAVLLTLLLYCCTAVYFVYRTERLAGCAQLVIRVSPLLLLLLLLCIMRVLQSSCKNKGGTLVFCTAVRV